MDRILQRVGEIGLSAWFRVLFAVSVPLLLVSGAWALLRFGNPFICVFHAVTGWYCPGCGSGRAMASLLRFRFAEALDRNALAVISLPFVLYYLIRTYASVVFRRPLLPAIRVRPAVIVTAAAVVVLFTLARNIPMDPFTVLAP